MIRLRIYTSREGSGKGVRVTEGKLWHRVLQSYTDKSPAAINVLAVLVRVGNQLSSLPTSVYGRICRNSADLFQPAFPFTFETVLNEPKKIFNYFDW